MLASSIYRREARKQCRALGLCVNCLKRLAVSSFCGVCLEARAEWQAKRKARWIAEGRCSRCGAEREDVGRRMCAKCRLQMNNYKLPKTVESRFLQGIAKGEDGSCWEWTKGKSSSKYGVFYVNHKTEYAHRYAYKLWVGEIPDGMMIDHICHNPSCVNPKHLRLASASENSRNSIKPKSNNSGFKGAHFHKSTGKWRSQITVSGKVLSLGLFETPEEAHTAYAEAAARYFKEFANTGEVA